MKEKANYRLELLVSEANDNSFNSINSSSKKLLRLPLKVKRLLLCSSTKHCKTAIFTMFLRGSLGKRYFGVENLLQQLA